MENTNEINIIVKDKKPTSEAVKRAKAKYYQKKKLDEAYMQDMRDRSNKYYVEKRPYEKKKELNKLKVMESYLPQIITE
jgi:hypothetical protein